MNNRTINALNEMYEQLLPEANEKNDTVVKGVLAFIKRYIDVIEKEQLSEEALDNCTSIIMHICNERIENYDTGIQELVKEYNAKENLTKKELSEQVDLISKMSLISSYRTKESQVLKMGVDDVLEEIKNTDTSVLEKQLDNMTSEQADAIDELFDDFFEEFGGAKKYGIKLKELMGTIPELEKWI